MKSKINNNFNVSFKQIKNYIDELKIQRNNETKAERQQELTTRIDTLETMCVQIEVLNKKYPISDKSALVLDSLHVALTKPDEASIAYFIKTSEDFKNTIEKQGASSQNWNYFMCAMWSCDALLNIAVAAAGFFAPGGQLFGALHIVGAMDAIEAAVDHYQTAEKLTKPKTLNDFSSQVNTIKEIYHHSLKRTLIVHSNLDTINAIQENYEAKHSSFQFFKNTLDLTLEFSRDTEALKFFQNEAQQGKAFFIYDQNEKVIAFSTGEGFLYKNEKKEEAEANYSFVASEEALTVEEMKYQLSMHNSSYL